MSDPRPRRLAVPPMHPVVRKLQVIHALQEWYGVRDAARDHMRELRNN